MKKFLFVLLMLCGTLLSASAQRIYSSDGAWTSFMKQQCVFRLVAYGAYSNGVETNRYYPQGKNADEGIVLSLGECYHLNTLDGDFVYGVKIDGEYLRIFNKRRKVGNNITTFDSQFSSWIKLIWCENRDNGMMLFTVDSYGTYRYFQYIGTFD